VKDTEAGDLLAPLDDAETRTAIIAERALLAELQGGCQVPLGAWARVERGELILDACGYFGGRISVCEAGAPRLRRIRPRNLDSTWRGYSSRQALRTSWKK